MERVYGSNAAEAAGSNQVQGATLLHSDARIARHVLRINAGIWKESAVESSASDQIRTGRRTRRTATAAALTLAYVALASFPGDYRAITTGLDPSWYYALNVLPYTPYRFGEDVVFTMGPLGYLLAPQDIGSNLIQAAVVWILSQTLTIALVIYHFRRNRSLAQVVAFGLVYLVALSFGLAFEYRILILLSLLLTVFPEDRRVWRWVMPLAASLAALLLFIKFTLGLGAAGMLSIAGIAWLLQRRVRIGEALLFMFAVYMGMVAVLSLTLIGSPEDFVTWLRLGAQIVGGFSAAMAVGDPGPLPVVGVATIVSVALAFSVFGRPDRHVAALALPLSIPVLLAFPHSFVRHDGRFLFSVLIAAVGVMLLTATDRRRMIAGGLAFILCLPGALIRISRPGCDCPWRLEAFGSAGLANLAALLQLDETRSQLQVDSVDSLMDDRLPEDWVEEIRESGGTVDAIPWEIAFTVANDLPWVPNPVLQTYHAYTSGLDGRVGDHFRGDDAPEFLLVQWIDIDGRHPMLASPSVWRSIIANYELARPETAIGPYWEVALLRRRSEPLSVRPISSRTQEARPGEWIEVPTWSGPVVASIQVSPTFLGRLRALVFRTEVIYADLQYEPGGFVRVRVLPGTLDDGLLISNPPLVMQEFLGLLGGALPRRVIRFRLSGEGLASYAEEMTIRWSNMPSSDRAP